MSDTQTPDSADIALSASPGEQLRRERESQGLTVGEVAGALNLRPAVIRGLEEDSYEEVPIPTYRRGYLRAYAHLLGIEERPVLDAYRVRFGSEENERRVIPVQVTRPPSRLGAWLFRLVTLLVIAGLIGLTLMWWQSRGGNEPPDIGAGGPVAVDGLDGTTTTIDEPDTPAPADAGEAPLPAEEEAAPAPTGDAGLSDDDLAFDAAPPPADDMPPPADDEALLTLSDELVQPSPGDAPATAEEEGDAVGDTRRLELTFNEQSWTEIFDADNQRLLVGLQEPGTSASVEGEPPFRLTVGNATGVGLVWRGESIDLGARAGANNVARFTLGE